MNPSCKPSLSTRTKDAINQHLTNGVGRPGGLASIYTDQHDTLKATLMSPIESQEVLAPLSTRQALADDRATMKKVGRLVQLEQVIPSRQEYVYFVQAATLGLIKIGSAWSPMDRLYTLQTGSPDTLRLLAVIRCSGAARGDEKAIHQKFAEYRSHGEWFRPAPELLAYIEAEAVDYEELLMRENRDLANAILSR